MPDDPVAIEATVAIDEMRKRLKSAAENLVPGVVAQRSLEELMRIRYELAAIRKALKPEVD